VRFASATGDKETRAKPVSAQAEAGNVKLVRGLWNDEFLRVLENFPAGRHDDEVDALSGAYERACERGTGGIGGKEIEEIRRANPHLFPAQQWDEGRFGKAPQSFPNEAPSLPRMQPFIPRNGRR
jgi:hypothetical protein